MKRIVMMCCMAMSVGVAMPVFAQSAPVYDADAMPTQQYEGNAGPEQPQDLPPPPPPSQDGTFVPVQQQAQPQAQAQPQQQQSIVSIEDSAPAPAPSGSTEQRLRKVEQQLNNLLSNDTGSRVDALQDQIQSLRSDLEQLSHQLAQVQNQQKSMYSDLDKRISQPSYKPAVGSASSDAAADQTADVPVSTTPAPAATTKSGKKLASKSTKPAKTVANTATSDTATADTASATTASASATQNQPNVAEEQQIYQTAYNLIKAKKYNDAVVALNSMLKKYPSGQFAANAHYWLGELYGLMSKNDQSLNEFSAVVKTYPDSPRVSDAQLKVGLIFASQFKWADAKNAFKKVINRYPGTSSARLAMEQLKQIKQAGH